MEVLASVLREDVCSVQKVPPIGGCSALSTTETETLGFLSSLLGSSSSAIALVAAPRCSPGPPSSFIPKLGGAVYALICLLGLAKAEKRLPVLALRNQEARKTTKSLGDPGG